MTNPILLELARTKAYFQARSIAAALGAPPPYPPSLLGENPAPARRGEDQTIKDSLTVESPLDTSTPSMSTLSYGLRKPRLIDMG